MTKVSLENAQYNRYNSQVFLAVFVIVYVRSAVCVCVGVSVCPHPSNTLILLVCQ